MNKWIKPIFILLLLTVFFGTGFSNITIYAMDDQELLNSSWDKIESTARNSEVNFYMWGGDRRINQWIDTFVSNQMQELYNIELNRVPMGPDDYLNKLLGEKQIGRKKGTIDLLWINGENFKTAKENGLLFGPFAELLPNYSHYLDTSSPETTMDFGFPTEGYEVPYGKAQFVFIYDKAKINNPPHSFRGLVDWIKDNPGKFTYPALPDFTGSAFIRHVIYAQTGGYKQYCNLSEKEVRDKIKPAMKLLNDIKPYLWRKGKTYPATIAQLHNMFADGEVWMTMSYHPTKASGEIVKGNFPETVRTFVLEDGTISNTHFLAIPFNAPNKSGALVVANYLEGFEAQLSKYKPANWGDMPVFSFDKLSEAEKEKVDGVDLGIATLDQKTLQDHRLPEIPAQFIPVIEDVWDSTVAQ